MADQYQGFSNPTIIPEQKYGWQAANQGVSSLISKASDYLMSQRDKVQSLQLQQAQDLSKFKTLDQIYYGGQHGPMLDNLLSQNPYGKQLISGQKPSSSFGQSSPTPGSMTAGANMIGMPGMSTMSGDSVLPSQDVSSTGDSTGSMSSINPLSSGPVVTSMTQKAFEPPSVTIQNPRGEATVAGAKSQAEANVAVPKEYATSMVKTQALAQENLARDNTQMMSVFQTLKSLHDIHSQLADKNLAGTHLGEMGEKALPYLGDFAALTGQKPQNVQNAVMDPKNQNLIGQFQAGRNEGITRAIQPLQNQIDKTGSSRISESLMKMTEGEYGNLTDTQNQFEGKTLGTAKTLYRITLASQLYADQLKAQGIRLDSKSKDFNPDVVANDIFNNAQNIQLSPAQNAQFNQYANQILGTKEKDYSGGSMNPVMNQQPTQQQPMQQGNQQAKQLDMNTAKQILQQAGGDKDKARMLAKQQGYQF